MKRSAKCLPPPRLLSPAVAVVVSPSHGNSPNKHITHTSSEINAKKSVKATPNLPAPAPTTDDMIISHLKSCSPDASHLDRMWKCPKCKSRIGFNHKETHIATCKGSAKDNRTCSKCKQLCQSLSACQKHTAVCRGSEEANLTCQTCSRKFKTFASRIRSHTRKHAPNLSLGIYCSS